MYLNLNDEIKLNNTRRCGVKIYNSLTRRKEEFVAIKKGRIGMYVCGPTVYDEPHIGHARSAYIFDCIRRYFEYKGYKVTFVRNVTDVDDKIIEKARSEVRGQRSEVSIKERAKEVSKRYLDAYHEDMELLGMGKPDEEPKATGYIPKMIKFIERLIEKGCAYEAGGDVYFNIKSAKGYGRLSNQSLEKMEVGARVAPGEKKRDPLDFVLWKSSKEDEPSWRSPWGRGRPGWHIECSVMSSDLLGDEFDIHGGGIDLIFPHHENEIAQSKGAGKRFARYWMHNGLLTINGEKMAKSLGNFISIKDFRQKIGPSFRLKLFFLSAHYRSPLDYNEEALHVARANERTFGIFFKRIRDEVKEKTKRLDKEVEEFKKRLIEAMDDDFNTPVSLSVLLEMVSEGHKNLDHREKEKALSISTALCDLLNIFGLKEIKDIYESLRTSEEIVNKLLDLQLEYIDQFEKYNVEFIKLTSSRDDMTNYKRLSKSFIELRDKARREGDFKLADKIREDLGVFVILEDTREGTRCRPKI